MSVPATVFFSRSMREGMRRGNTYMVRTALLAIMCGILFSAQATSAARSAPGLTLFTVTAMLNLGLTCAAAPGYFASIITEEKEAGTLGLLKMAGMGPVSILLGKSTSQVIGALMLVLTQMPFIVLAVTLGGVSLTQVYAGCMTMLAFLIFIANLALLCSVVCRRSSRAAGLSGFLLAAFFVLPPVGRGVLRGLVAGRVLPARGAVDRLAGDFLGLLQRASPFGWLARIGQTGFSGPVLSYQVWSNLALAGGCFLLSWAAFERLTREQATAAPARGLMVRRLWGLSWLRPGRPWRNALAWKDFHFLSGGLPMLLGRTVVLGLVPLLLYVVGRSQRAPIEAEGLGTVIVVVALAALFVELLGAAGRIFGDERKWGTLSGVAALPLPAWRIALGKALGNLLGLAPYVGWLAVGAVLVGKPFWDGLDEAVRGPTFWWFMVSIVLLLHLIACMSLFMRRGGTLVALVIWFTGTQFAMVPFGLMAGRRGSDGLLVAFLVLMAVTVLFVILLQRGIAKALAWPGNLE
jgi:ABC-type transport system involved in multi-copper enzyme maturation permease subunit